MLEIDIRFYGPEQPFTIPLPGVQLAAAQAYLERVKSEVIEAQRHNAPSVTIRPLGRHGREVPTMDPSRIREIVLVDQIRRAQPTG